MTLIDASSPDLGMVLILGVAAVVIVTVFRWVGRWRGWFE